MEEFLRPYFNKMQIIICESFGEIKEDDICIKSCLCIKEEHYILIMNIHDGKGFVYEDSCEIEVQEQSLEIFNRIIQTDKTGAKYLNKKLKNGLKKQFFRVLSKYTGRELPWGILTGIRPTSIARDYISSGVTEAELVKIFNDKYYLKEKRAKLLYDIALKEMAVLKATPPGSVSLYIGIPFCPSRCLYCSFISQMSSKDPRIMENYVEALTNEIKAAAKLMDTYGKVIQTIYVGGGTPTALPHYLLEKLMRCIKDNISFDYISEYTLEAGRPDSITFEKLDTARKLGADRVSVNPQTMNGETLRIIGRNHSPMDVLRAFKEAREAGFENINSDIIMGLPGETLDMFKYTLEKVLSLRPESITLHSLAIKRASRLNQDYAKFHQNDNNVLEMSELAFNNTAREGMYPYYMYRQKNIAGNLENTGFCLANRECIYNIQIMGEKQTILALGAGGISKFVYPNENRLERVANVKTAEEYIMRINEMIERKEKYIDKNNW